MALEWIVVGIALVTAAAVLSVRVRSRLRRVALAPAGTVCGPCCDGCPVARQGCHGDPLTGPGSRGNPHRSGPVVQTASLLIVAGVLVTCPSARAADTLEPFDVGLTDVEWYVHGDGSGAGSPGVLGEFVVGGGLTRRWSVWAGTSLAFLDLAAGDGLAIGLGTYATPLDTDHVDLDLLLSAGFGGRRLGGAEIAPGIELNLDARPGLAAWGGYLRLELPVSGEFRRADHGGPTVPSLAIALNPGVYWTIAERHMILLEADVAIPTRRGAETPAVEVGGAAVGYNLRLADAAEVISQVYLDIPQARETMAVGLTIGMILSPPSPSTTP